MRTFAEKPKATQQSTSARSTMPHIGLLQHSHEVNQILNLQRTIGNHAVQWMVGKSTEVVGGDSTSVGIPRFGHDFSRVRVRPAVSQADQAKSPASPSALGEGLEAEDVSQSPRTPIPIPTPGPADGGTALDGGAAPTKKAKLKSGPTYTPSGTIKATKSGGKKKAAFKLSAEFENDPKNGFEPSYGEVRQYIQWTKAADIPNHAGFKPAASYSAKTWYEDRDDVGKRYGHRSGAYSECISINHYEDKKGKQDCANGEVFKGEDTPIDGSGAKTGEWKFELRAVDTSDGNKEIGTPASVTVDWNV